MDDVIKWKHTNTGNIMFALCKGKVKRHKAALTDDWQDRLEVFEWEDDVYDVIIVKPIPLTKEILEKNGFKYEEFPKFAVTEITEKTKISFTHHSGSKTIFVEINEPNFKLASSCVLWVHELQNILRDARIEKEITI